MKIKAKKMYNQTIIICFIAICCIPKIQSYSCETISNCVCKIEFGYTVYNCLPDPKNISNVIQIAIKPGNDIKTIIECEYEPKLEDYSIIANIHMPYLKILRISYCPIVNKNITFRNFLNKINIKRIDEIEYRILPRHNEQNIIQGRHFELLENIKNITINGDPNTIYKSDLLNFTKNLDFLVLYKGHIELTSNFFQSTQQIKYIELQSNIYDKQLPDNLFHNLTNLRHLALWNMNMLMLNETTFNTLNNLRILDLHSNYLQTLPETILDQLINLQEIDLNLNNFTTLPTKLFQFTKSLTKIYLRHNTNALNLSNGGGLFANLPHLELINLMNSQITDVSEDLFWNSTNILHIKMDRNRIERLPSKLFRDTINLRILDLSSNQISSISDDLFKTLENLQELDLSNNQISSIPSESFLYQKNLIKLNFGQNFLTRLDKYVLGYLKKLQLLNLNNNQLSLDTVTNPFNELQELETLDLSNNLITHMRNDWSRLFNHMKMLNLAHNKIRHVEFGSIYFGRNLETKVDLTHNLIETIDLRSAEFIINLTSSTLERKKDEIIISNNPINCNCQIHDLVRYFKGQMISKVYDTLNLTATNLKCAEPMELHDRNVDELELNELYCTIDNNSYCLKQCNCKVRQIDLSTIIDCSNRNLTLLPKYLPYPKRFPNIILHMNNNNISTWNINQTYANVSNYNHIKELYIQNNHLSQIIWLPKQLQVIQLHSNQFEHINITLLNNLSHLRQLTLHNNPWMCTCKNVDLMSFIQKQYAKILNSTSILCDQTRAFESITQNDLCETSRLTLVSVVTCFTILTLMITITVIVYYRNEMAIRIWLYKHKLCLWCDAEYEFDKDKEWDAFVCHAHQDEPFVVEQLIPNLEQCENPFKLRIHSRDWLAGVMIPEQIARDVCQSKRTIVILSQHFLKSTWAKMEFRSAHKQGLEERRSRVIMIKLGDIGPEDELDPEIKDYMKLNTYIEWGDKSFWDKLRYALPHPPPLNSRATLISQHIIKALGRDTKLELQTITTQPTSINQQIPTVTQITPPADEKTNDKNPLILRQWLNNLQKQFVHENNVNRNIA